MNNLNSYLDKWEKTTRNTGLTKLHKRSQIKKLIVLRDRGDSLKDIGEELSVTAARVSQIYRSFKRYDKNKNR